MPKSHLTVGFGLPYKLLITLEVKPPSEYRRFLSSNETVHGKVTKFVFHIKNMGDESVPRGHAKIYFKTPYGMGDFTRTAPSTEIAALQPNETFSLKISANFTTPGLWFATLNFELAEKEEEKKKIEYYQFEGAEPSLENWLCPLYAVDRHQLDLISRFEKLNKKKVK